MKYTKCYQQQRGYKVWWKTIPKENRDWNLVGHFPHCKFKTYAEYEKSLEKECWFRNRIFYFKCLIKNIKRKLYEKIK